MSKDTTAVQPGEQVLAVPLGDIHVEYSWNSRSVRRLQDIADAEPGSTGFDGFSAGIKANGQISPVILRKTGGKTITGQETKKPYELIVGFRRYKAISNLNEAEKGKNDGKTIVPNLPNGTISAIVRDIPTVTQARILNGLENTGRANLKAPDLVFLCAELSKDGLNQTAIGEALGITQGWVSRLLQIAKLPAVVLSHWRDGTPIPAVTTKDGIFEIKKGANILYTEMTEPNIRALAGLKGPPEDIIVRYIRAISPVVAQGEGPGTGQRERDTVREHVQDIATLMACMVKAGVLETGSLDWARVIGPKAKKGYPIDSGKDDSAARINDLCDAASEAFDAAIDKADQGGKGAAA